MPMTPQSYGMWKVPRDFLKRGQKFEVSALMTLADCWVTPTQSLGWGLSSSIGILSVTVNKKTSVIYNICSYIISY